MNNRFIATEKRPDGSTSVKILVGNKTLSFVINEYGQAAFSDQSDVASLQAIRKYISDQLLSIVHYYKITGNRTGLQPSDHFLFNCLTQTQTFLDSIKFCLMITSSCGNWKKKRTL